MAALELYERDYRDGRGGLATIAQQFEKLDKWPVENLTKRRFDLEPYWEAPDKQIHRSFNSDLTKKVIWDINQIRTRWHPRIAAESRAMVWRSESGQADLYSDPFFGTHARAWNEYLLSTIPLWQNYYSCFFPCYYLRRMMPFKPYQEEGSQHFELYYALCVGWEFGVSFYLLIDDLLDETPERTGHVTWALQHQHTRGMDSVILANFTIRLCSDLIPESHPCKSNLVTVFLENAGSFLDFFQIQPEMRTIVQQDDEAGRRAVLDHFITSYGEKSYAGYNVCRGALWYQCILDWARYFACYRDLPMDTGLMNVLTEYNQFVVQVDDLIDTNFKLGSLTDIIGAEPGNVYMFGFLQDIRAEKDPAEKEKLRQIWMDHFGTFKTPDARLIQKLWKDRKILLKYVKPIIAKQGVRFADMRIQAEATVNFPCDAFWPTTIYMLSNDSVMSTGHANGLIEMLQSFESHPGPGRVFGVPGSEEDPFKKLIDYFCDPTKDFPIMDPLED